MKKKPELKRRQNNPNLEPPGMICGAEFKEIAQETGLKEKGVASAYYRSIKKLRAEMGDVK